MASDPWKKFTSDQYLVHDYYQSIKEELPQDIKFEDVMRATEVSSDNYVIERGKHGTKEGPRLVKCLCIRI